MVLSDNKHLPVLCDICYVPDNFRMGDDRDGWVDFSRPTSEDGVVYRAFTMAYYRALRHPGAGPARGIRVKPSDEIATARIGQAVRATLQADIGQAGSALPPHVAMGGIGQAGPPLGTPTTFSGDWSPHSQVEPAGHAGSPARSSCSSLSRDSRRSVSDHDADPSNRGECPLPLSLSECQARSGRCKVA